MHLWCICLGYAMHNAFYFTRQEWCATGHLHKCNRHNPLQNFLACMRHWLFKELGIIPSRPVLLEANAFAGSSLFKCRTSVCMPQQKHETIMSWLLLISQPPPASHPHQRSDQCRILSSSGGMLAIYKHSNSLYSINLKVARWNVSHRVWNVLTTSQYWTCKCSEVLFLICLMEMIYSRHTTTSSGCVSHKGIIKQWIFFKPQKLRIRTMFCCYAALIMRPWHEGK